MSRAGKAIVTLWLALAGWPAAAQTTAPVPEAPKAFVVGARVGMGLPQVFSQLRNFGVYELEVGYLLPVWERRLQLLGVFSYSQPPSSDGKPDPRLATADGAYRFELTQREYVLEVGLLVRAFPPGRLLNPYGRVGFRIYLLDTLQNGQSGGVSFGQYNEKFTEPGFVVGGGIDVRLGPGDSNTGMLTVLVGYRFFL